MCGELGYAAAYVHSFYMLSCVERHVDCSRSDTGPVRTGAENLAPAGIRSSERTARS
jgi:hypothetical protein